MGEHLPLPSGEQREAPSWLRRSEYNPRAELVPIMEKHVAAAAALGTGSIYATKAYQPRPDDQDEMDVWIHLNAVFATARTTHLCDYVAMVDAELADRKVHENPSFCRYLQLVAGYLVMHMDASSNSRTASGSAGAMQMQTEYVHGSGSAGSAALPKQMIQIPCTQKSSVRAQVDLGSAMAPSASL